jgi:hypothetical protein
MLRFLRKAFVIGGSVAAFLTVLLVVGFLQEIHGDDIPELARKQGLRTPLADPRIVVSIQRNTLTLYDGEVAVKRYNVASGHLSAGRVSDREGSTPLGEYAVIGKEIRKDVLNRGSRFLLLNFPTETDALRAYDLGLLTRDELDRVRRAELTGAVPPFDTVLGGPVGIQGNFFFFRESRFTDGNIALSNGEMNELFEHVPVGTPVVIEL